MPPPPLDPLSPPGQEQPELWDAVFDAQSKMAELMGPTFDEQVERNLQAVRERLVAEQHRREAREIGMALIRGYRAADRELRAAGLKLPSGAGTGGRQCSRERLQRQRKPGA